MGHPFYLLLALKSAVAGQYVDPKSELVRIGMISALTVSLYRMKLSPWGFVGFH